MNTGVETFSLQRLIDNHLKVENVADPKDLAENIAAEIPEDQLRGVVVDLLRDRVRERNDEIRRRLAKNTVQGRTRSEKWDKVREDHSTGVLDIMRQRVYVPGAAWTFLGDLTIEAAQAVAGGYDDRAAQNADQADRFRELIRLMEESRAKKVRDLSADRVKEIFA